MCICLVEGFICQLSSKILVGISPLGHYYYYYHFGNLCSDFKHIPSSNPSCISDFPCGISPSALSTYFRISFNNGLRWKTQFLFVWKWLLLVLEIHFHFVWNSILTVFFSLSILKTAFFLSFSFHSCCWRISLQFFESGLSLSVGGLYFF